MSNLLIETSAIRTFPKSLSSKHSSGNFGISSSSPFPKARNLKQRSLKMFVLQLFNKFTPFYPMLMGCRQFHSTPKAGPWTLLTSNPFNTSSAILKTGGNGDWLTTVAHWHMRYSLKQISWQQHEQVSELCANPFALSSRTVFGCSGASCIVHYLVLLHAIITHIECSCACKLNNILNALFTYRPLLNLLLPQPSSTFMDYGACCKTHVQLDTLTSHGSRDQVSEAGAAGHSQLGHKVCLNFVPFLIANVFSTTAELGHIIEGFCVALVCADFPRIQDLLGRMTSLVGKVVALCIAAHLLERAVSFFLSFGLERH